MSTEPLQRIALMKVPSEGDVIPEVPTGCMQVLRACVSAGADV